jgi:putative ABC transport system permease protein
MWKNYLKISLRNLRKRKLYTAINLFGLTIALVSFIAISLYIHHEWSYDRMITDSDRIYKINQEFVSNGESELVGSSPPLLPVTLREEFTEVEQATLIFDLSIFSSVMIDAGQGNQEESKFAYVDEYFYDVFDFKMIAGNRETVLSEPNQIVLTESTADRLFGSAVNAEGKSLKVNGKDYLVTGVMQDFPSTSHMEFDFLASFKTHRDGREPQWSPSNYYNYVKMKPGADMAQFKSNMDQMVDKYLGSDMDEYGFETAFFTQPLTSIHLGDPTLNRIKPGTEIKYLYIFGVVAILLIAIGIINYVNLATAEATERNKEVGLRKVMGAGRMQLFGQFVSESMLLSFGAILLSILLLYLIAIPFEDFGGVPLNFELLFSPAGMAGLLGLALVVGLLAGFYPSMILSQMQPLKALGNKLKIGGGAWVRKSLVVFQFFVSMGLLISTFVVKNQLDFMQEVNLGYEKEQVVALNYHYNMREAIPTLADEMVRSGAAISISRAADMPHNVKAGYRIFPGGDNTREFLITGYAADPDLIKTINLELLEGENYSESDPLRSNLEDENSLMPILLNESAIAEMGWTAKEAIGKRVNVGFTNNALVKGVVKDFYFNSLHQKVGPMVIFNDPNEANILLIKLNAGNPKANLATIGEVWKKLVPDRPFNPKFLDQEYASLYQSEQNVSLIFSLFAGIAVFIALMGLFGLVSYVALRRTREISIRKVLGATQGDVLQVLSMDFLKLLGVSAVLAIGFGIWFSDSWLGAFANRTALTIWPFVIAILLVMVLAILTIGYRSWKVFRLNPATTLKSE